MPIRKPVQKSDAAPPPSRQPRSRAADVVVQISMALAASALFVGLYRQLDIAFWLAVTTALSTYIVLVLVHAYVRRSDQVTELTGALSDLRAEVDRLKQEAQIRTLMRDHSPAATQSRAAAQVPAQASSPAPNLEAFRPRDFARDFANHMAMKKPAPLVVPVPTPASAQDGPDTPVAASAKPSTDEMKEFWSFRPSAVTETEVPASATSAASALSADASPFAQGAAISSAAPQSDLEFLQESIKKLAETVNAAETMPPARPQPAPATAPIVEAPPVANLREDAIDQSVKALRSASLSLRASEDLQPAPAAEAAASASGEEPRYEVIAATPPPIDAAETGAFEVIAATPAPYAVEGPPPAPPPPIEPSPPLFDHTEALAAAVSSGTLDVFLEPILGLGDQRTEHYEITVRLRDSSGISVSGREAAAALAGTDVLAAFDIARLERTAMIAGRLAAKGKSGSLFSEFSAAALSAEAFLSAFSDTYDAQPSIGQQLVLSFAQSEVRSFSDAEWMTLVEMRDYGFRFAVTDVVDLDMDFSTLASKGFAFVKLDQDVFLNGMPVGNTHVPAHELCAHIAGFGQTIIVGGITESAKHAQIFGFGVLLGQGRLFGGPRPVKADALKRPAHAAA